MFYGKKQKCQLINTGISEAFGRVIMQQHKISRKNNNIVVEETVCFAPVSADRSIIHIMQRYISTERVMSGENELGSEENMQQAE